MPTIGSDISEHMRTQRAKRIHANLVAKGLDPRSMGFSRAYHKAVRSSKHFN